MNKRALWIGWYGLLLICGLYGLLPEPQGVWKIIGIVLSIGAFVPAGLLLKMAYDCRDRKTMVWIQRICLISLGLTVVLYTLNVLSTAMTPIWGVVFHVLLSIGATPMLCAQYWVLGLFLWCCLLWTAITLRRSLSKT